MVPNSTISESLPFLPSKFSLHLNLNVFFSSSNFPKLIIFPSAFYLYLFYPSVCLCHYTYPMVWPQAFRLEQMSVKYTTGNWRPSAMSNLQNLALPLSSLRNRTNVYWTKTNQTMVTTVASTFHLAINHAFLLG